MFYQTGFLNLFIYYSIIILLIYLLFYLFFYIYLFIKIHNLESIYQILTKSVEF